jgi:nucleoside-diphosphate-sugar epimerase
MLIELGSFEVRAGVRRWGSAARIGRYPVEIVLCDVLNHGQLEAAMAGITHVIHCAYGDGETNVRGTRNVLEAALAAGVRRVVHMSTIDVYGHADGEVREESGLQRTGRPYGDSKIEAEEICAEVSARGLEVSILRPTIVYGPFSAGWTLEFAERLQMRPWLLPPADCEGYCNLVYVDDLVSAALLALEAPGAVGEAFTISGPDRVTWNEYFHALNDAMGLPPLVAANRTASRLGASIMLPVRKTAKVVLNRFSSQIMSLYQRSAIAMAVMRGGERLIRQSPTPGEFDMYSRKTFYHTDKAARLLGYRPAYDMSAGVRLSAAWLRHHGLIRAS